MGESLVTLTINNTTWIFLRFPPKRMSDTVCLFKERGRDDSTENLRASANALFQSSLSSLLVHHKNPRAKRTEVLDAQRC